MIVRKRGDGAFLLLLMISSRQKVSAITLALAAVFVAVHAEDNPHGDIFSNKPVPAVVDFNRDVRPIISSKCYHCHGPDEGSRKAKLRLDSHADAIKEIKGAFAIKPGDLAASEVVARITSTDGDEVMPPPKEGHALTSREVEVMKKWIVQGAPYADHWAFVKPVKVNPPTIGQATLKPIDAFIAATLADNGLSMAAEADRNTLVRRVALDLTGLPPTPDEVVNFTAPSASYEAMIDHYLAKPAYGERWARVWLDLARYADSAGYGSDPLRLNIWPYRDWVIQAFNRNLPYDQFTTEQIAGDLLPNATQDQLVATAFHRNTMTNTEGGTDDEEFRVAAVKDRIATTAQVWMGLTLGCAQCHTHKFDPITQQEYYEFFAIFNQTEDNDRADDQPVMSLPTPEQTTRMEALQKRIKELEQTLQGNPPELVAELQQWENSLSKPVVWEPLDITDVSAATYQFEKKPDGSWLTVGGTSDKTHFTIKAKSGLKEITAFRLEALEDDSLPHHGPGRSENGNFVITELTVNAKGSPGDIALHHATATFEQDKFEADNAIDTDSKKGGWAIGGGTGHSQALVLETQKPLQVIEGTELTFGIQQGYGDDHVLGRFRILATSQQAPILEAPVAVREILAVAREARTPIQESKLMSFFKGNSQTLTGASIELQQSRKELAGIKPEAVPVMREFAKDKQRESHLFIKGNFLMPADKVSPSILKSFNPAPAHEEINRLTVTKWIMSRDNPLTARVAVNRFWAQLFGTGLVETEEDFGTQGSLPSHPELLDWLAVDFMEQKWDIKALLKTMVMSATYRQSAKPSAEALQKDARNRLLSHYARRRLDAEQVRDQALAISGLLSAKLGGPSVFPPQPDGLWRAAFNGQRSWETSKGEDRYRRGLYTFWRRTVPYPSMATFDAPSRENCTVRRLPTNTPLQAFVTMNDPAYVEMSQSLGRRLMKEGGESVESRVRYGLQLALARPAKDGQISALVQLYQQELTNYQAQPEEAKKLATEPLGALPAGADPAVMAAWTMVANVLLNMDAVLMKG
ncbi:PSD1 and planctomycete cytochrome C domain-containing protein [soil metagenome]